MPSFNSVTLMGNLTRTPELRYLPKGTAVARCSLAINRKWRTEAGEEREEVTFVDCDAWGKTAETLAKYCAKGDPLFITGRLKLDTWKDKESGEDRSRLGVVIEQFQFLKSKPAGSAPAGSKLPAPSSVPASAGPPEDDVPF